MGGAGGVGNVAGGHGAGGDSSALPRGAPGTRGRPHPPKTSLGARQVEPLSLTPHLPRTHLLFPVAPPSPPTGRPDPSRGARGVRGRGLPGRGPCAAVCGDRLRRGRHALCAGGCEKHLNWRAGGAGSGCYYCRERESAGEPASREPAGGSRAAAAWPAAKWKEGTATSRPRPSPRSALWASSLRTAHGRPR